MASYGMNDVKNGMKILVNNQPAVIIDTEYVKPGKGQAFTRVKYRQIRTGRVQEITMKSTDSVEAPGVVDTDMQQQMRDSAEQDFPDAKNFRFLHASGRLTSVETAASRMLALLDSPTFGSEPIAELRAERRAESRAPARTIAKP